MRAPKRVLLYGAEESTSLLAYALNVRCWVLAVPVSTTAGLGKRLRSKRGRGVAEGGWAAVVVLRAQGDDMAKVASVLQTTRVPVLQVLPSPCSREPGQPLEPVCRETLPAARTVVGSTAEVVDALRTMTAQRRGPKTVEKFLEAA